MVAVDSNILVYAHRADSEWHPAATACMRTLAQGLATWAIPWPCVHEFFAIVSHTKIFDPPSTTHQAIEQVDAWLGSSSVLVIGEAANHWNLLKESLLLGKIQGPLVHDARIATICEAHGVTEFLTADRDFSRFPSLVTRNPLV